MIIKSFSPSSYNAIDFCEHKFYLSYGLGYREPSGKKAELGTIVHTILECLGLSKIHYDQEKFEHKELGLLDTNIDIDNLIDIVFTHHVFKSHNDFDSSDLITCKNWVYRVLNEQIYDPRNLNVIETEKYFDFLIMEDWAEYKHNNEIGYLGVRGIIDLVTEPEPGIIHVIDWKTGRRMDWNTGEIKEIADLNSDIQLLMYAYATNYLYPNAKTILVTIYYINDGGPYTIEPFSNTHKKYIEKKLKNRFEQIRKITEPKLLSENRTHWRCSKLCFFAKEQYQNTEKSMCEFFRDKIREEGIDQVTERYKKK